MSPTTHFAAGLLVGGVTGITMGNPYVGLAAGVVGGLIPDIDHPGSILYHIIGHRTITHKVEFIAGLTVLLYTLCSCVALPALLICTAFAMGGLSHLILDALTRSGIRPFLLVSYHFRGPLRSGNMLLELPLSLFLIYCTFQVLGVI